MNLSYLFRSNWVTPALKVALLVGSILLVINHGEAIYEGRMTLGRWISIILSYLVPYCVYIFGKASNLNGQSKEED